IDRLRTKEYRDAEGNLQRAQEPYRAGRPVNVVSGFDRFLHYLIDAIILFALGFVLGFVMGTAQQRGFANFSMTDGHLEINFAAYLVNLAFYFFFELLTGSTPGKMLFGRIVINEYGERPDAGHIALRTISRLVPFEAFSCLAERGWHDTWSKTFVVNKKEAAELLELRSQQEKEAVYKISTDYLSNQGIQ
ncbi:MAG TPA: RDD family protein, partial [Bacteroidia bacterium]|nr:RDD family protein [Bacteroidia bacterium]